MKKESSGRELTAFFTYYVYDYIDLLTLSYTGNRLESVSEPFIGAQSRGYVTTGTPFTYDDAGNVTFDGGKGASFNGYNALNLPTEVERLNSNGDIMGKVNNTYDITGQKWSTNHTYYNQGTHTQNVKYVNGIELLDNGQFIVHHEEGRYISNSGENEHEYVISDHLGNGRIWFQDKDGDNRLSLDPANLEIKQIKHYYPFGMTMGIQSLQSYEKPRDRNQYNGIEFFDGLDYNMAFYRTLDPGIGRWMQVDPKAEYAFHFTPYNALFNNPVGYTDPKGDFPVPLLVAMAKGLSLIPGLIGPTLPLIAVAAPAVATTGIIAASSVAVGGVAAIGVSSSLQSISSVATNYVRSGLEGYGYHETLYDIRTSSSTDLISVPSQNGLPIRYENTFGYWRDGGTAFLKKFSTTNYVNTARMLSTYGGPNGIVLNIGTAIAGPETIVGGIAAKAAGWLMIRGIRNYKYYNSVEDLIKASKPARSIHDGQTQRFINGNADDIFNQLKRSYNGKLSYNNQGHPYFKAGKVRVDLTPSSTDIPTLRINLSRQIYNVRVIK